MTTPELRIEQHDNGVAVLVLDRPDAKNALTAEMRDGIVDAVRDFRRDPAVRAVVIRGEGDAFCAGMDLSVSTIAQAGKPDFNARSTSEALRSGVQTFIKELWELDKPTLAAVNGAAVGPGGNYRRGWAPSGSKRPRVLRPTRLPQSGSIAMAESVLEASRVSLGIPKDFLMEGGAPGERSPEAGWKR